MKKEFFAAALAFTVILSVAALPVYAGPDNNTNDIKNIINQCYTVVQIPDAVIRTCSTAIESDPKNAEAYKYRGIGYADKQRLGSGYPELRYGDPTEAKR